MRERPDQPDEELLERWAALPGRRAFKTHAFPGPGHPRIAFQADVKYLVVLRDPREALVSFRFFMAAQHDDVYNRFGVPHELRTAMTRPTFPKFFREVVLAAHWDGEEVPGGLLTGGFFDFVNAWWPLRERPNVLLLHFNEMKADHEGSLKRIAAFLGYSPDAETWARVVEYTSFAQPAQVRGAQGAGRGREVAQGGRDDPEGPRRQCARRRNDAGDRGRDPGPGGAPGARRCRSRFPLLRPAERGGAPA